MSANGKKHNSIIFITTLSVYLGLVLVGATPQVLAQAALTRPFDIKTEIELEDDLDKNPDEKALEKYADAFHALYLLAAEASNKNLGSSLAKDFALDCSFVLRSNDASRATFAGDGDDFIRRELTTPFREITKAFPHVFKDENAGAKFSLKLSETDFVFSSTLELDSNAKAEQTANFYENVLLRSRAERAGEPQLIIYDNTEISARNDQIFIVTRLPRAALEQLPARKNAQPAASVTKFDSLQ